MSPIENKEIKDDKAIFILLAIAAAVVGAYVIGLNTAYKDCEDIIKKL